MEWHWADHWCLLGLQRGGIPSDLTLLRKIDHLQMDQTLDVNHRTKGTRVRNSVCKIACVVTLRCHATIAGIRNFDAGSHGSHGTCWHSHRNWDMSMIAPDQAYRCSTLASIHKAETEILHEIDRWLVPLKPPFIIDVPLPQLIPGWSIGIHHLKSSQGDFQSIHFFEKMRYRAQREPWGYPPVPAGSHESYWHNPQWFQWEGLFHWVKNGRIPMDRPIFSLWCLLWRTPYVTEVAGVEICRLISVSLWVIWHSSGKSTT